MTEVQIPTGSAWQRRAERAESEAEDYERWALALTGDRDPKIAFERIGEIVAEYRKWAEQREVMAAACVEWWHQFNRVNETDLQARALVRIVQDELGLDR